MSFTFASLTGLPDVLLIRASRHGDERGWLTETYKRSAFVSAGIDAEFLQDNHSFSGPVGTLRGLHYQVAPAAQAKLVRVVVGAIFDVVVDLRPGPSFGKWASVSLSANEPSMLYVPQGFAHGFQTVVTDTAVVYKTTAEYSPEHERGILWSDPGLSVPWPFPRPILSERDQGWPTLSTAFA